MFAAILLFPGSKKMRCARIRICLSASGVCFHVLISLILSEFLRKRAGVTQTFRSLSVFPRLSRLVPSQAPLRRTHVSKSQGYETQGANWKWLRVALRARERAHPEGSVVERRDCQNCVGQNFRMIEDFEPRPCAACIKMISRSSYKKLQSIYRPIEVLYCALFPSHIFPPRWPCVSAFFQVSDPANWPHVPGRGGTKLARVRWLVWCDRLLRMQKQLGVRFICFDRLAESLYGL